MGKFMGYKGYRAIVEYSDEDETFIGRVLGLADVILFDGESITELKSSFHDAVDDYISLREKNCKYCEGNKKGDKKMNSNKINELMNLIYSYGDAREQFRNFICDRNAERCDEIALKIKLFLEENFQ